MDQWNSGIVCWKFRRNRTAPPFHLKPRQNTVVCCIKITMQWPWVLKGTRQHFYLHKAKVRKKVIRKRTKWWATWGKLKSNLIKGFGSKKKTENITYIIMACVVSLFFCLLQYENRHDIRRGTGCFILKVNSKRAIFSRRWTQSCKTQLSTLKHPIFYPFSEIGQKRPVCHKIFYSIVLY